MNKTILVDGMHCIYDNEFNVNKFLLEIINSFDNKKILLVNGFKEKGKKALEGNNFEAFSLEEEKIKKNNPEYFKTLLSRYNLNPMEVIYFDHDEGNAIGSGFVYHGTAIPQLQDKYVFADMVSGRVFYIDSQGLVPGRPAEIKELRITVDGAERNLVDFGGYPNTYARGDRADLRLGIDTQGELYALTKGDGWVRKLTAR